MTDKRANDPETGEIKKFKQSHFVQRDDEAPVCFTARMSLPVAASPAPVRFRGRSSFAPTRFDAPLPPATGKEPLGRRRASGVGAGLSSSVTLKHAITKLPPHKRKPTKLALKIKDQINDAGYHFLSSVFTKPF
jgi:hypothetical protein